MNATQRTKNLRLMHIHHQATYKSESILKNESERVACLVYYQF